MGPDAICLEMARFLLNAHPNITVDEYTLAYAIQNHIDKHYDEFFSGKMSCNDFARAIKEELPVIMDDETQLATTVQDYVDKIKTGDTESE